MKYKEKYNFKQNFNEFGLWGGLSCFMPVSIHYRLVISEGLVAYSLFFVKLNMIFDSFEHVVHEGLRGQSSIYDDGVT